MSQDKKSIAQRMADFVRRHQPAVARRERLLALREAEQRRYDELRATAREKFGTDNIDELRAQFAKLEEQRNQMMLDAEMELSAAEAALAEVESRVNFQQAQG